MRNGTARSQRIYVLLPQVAQGSSFVHVLALLSLLQVRTSSVAKFGCLFHGSRSSPNQVPEKSDGFAVSNGANDDTITALSKNKVCKHELHDLRTVALPKEGYDV